jgi:hypothetical protein
MVGEGNRLANILNGRQTTTHRQSHSTASGILAWIAVSSPEYHLNLKHIEKTNSNTMNL